MACWVMLDKVVAEVISSWSPVDDEFILFDAITDPLETGVHRSGFVLFEGMVGNAGSGRVISFDWVQHATF
jgi:hypothetical protein